MTSSGLLCQAFSVLDMFLSGPSAYIFMAVICASPFGQAIKSILLNQGHKVKHGSGGNPGSARWKNILFKEWCCFLLPSVH